MLAFFFPLLVRYMYIHVCQHNIGYMQGVNMWLIGLLIPMCAFRSEHNYLTCRHIFLTRLQQIVRTKGGVQKCATKQYNNNIHYYFWMGHLSNRRQLTVCVEAKYL